MSPRNLRLKHLSQEHTSAMRLVSSMRKALAEDADPAAMAAAIAATFARELEPHFLEEERHVVPMLQHQGRRDMAQRILDEHRLIRALVADLAQPGAADLVALSNALQAHVEYEESEVWEILEVALGATPSP